MRSLFLLLLFTFLSVVSTAQVTDREATLSGFPSIADNNALLTEKCLTTQLLQTREAKEHIAAFREWDEKGRPGMSLFTDYELGHQRNFRVRNIRNNTFSSVSFTLRAKGQGAFVWLEDDEFGEEKVTQEIVDAIFQHAVNNTPELSAHPSRGIIENNIEVFGQPPNVDGSGSLHILLTDVQDDWEPDSNTGYVAGFFDPVNLNPNNSNSNGMDIIYIDTYPHIYREDREANAGRAKSTLAHELQHLIHANYGNLNIFQNEGQSEWAELYNGYPGRTIEYVFQQDELNRFLFEWRRNSSQVLRDYQRASLFHGYLAERFGPEKTGAITRASAGDNAAYNHLLESSGKTLSEIIHDFHTANLINNRTIANGRFGYSDSRRSGVRATGKQHIFPSGLQDVIWDGELKYGGVAYTDIIGGEDVTIRFSSDQEVNHRVVAIPFSGEPEVFDSNSEVFLPGLFERISILSSNSDGMVDPNTSAQFRIESDWTLVPIFERILTYFGEIAFFTSLPSDPEVTDRPRVIGFAHRISPGEGGRLTNLSFFINNRESGIVGDANLNVILTESTPVTSGFRPATHLDTLSVSLLELNKGENSIPLPENWVIEAGSEYFIILEVDDLSGESGIELLLDRGSDNDTDSNYFPARTLVRGVNPQTGGESWLVFQDNNNLALSVTMSGIFDGESELPTVEITSPDIFSVSAGEPIVLTAEGTGFPAPVYQWFFDGKPISGATAPTLIIDNARSTDSGFYSVAAINVAGNARSEQVEVVVRTDEFILSQNYPNPFNPETTITFTLPEPAQVRLDIYNVEGRRVKTLINEFREADFYMETFNAADLASGVYVYHLRAGKKTLTRTMTLIK